MSRPRQIREIAYRPAAATSGRTTTFAAAYRSPNSGTISRYSTPATIGVTTSAYTAAASTSGRLRSRAVPVLGPPAAEPCVRVRPQRPGQQLGHRGDAGVQAQRRGRREGRQRETVHPQHGHVGQRGREERQSLPADQPVALGRGRGRRRGRGQPQPDDDLHHGRRRAREQVRRRPTRRGGSRRPRTAPRAPRSAAGSRRPGRTGSPASGPPRPRRPGCPGSPPRSSRSRRSARHARSGIEPVRREHRVTRRRATTATTPGTTSRRA